MVKNLITTIQVNFVQRTLFLQLGYFGLDFTSFYICIPQSWPMAGFGTFLTYLFFFTTRRRKDEADLLILSVNVQIII